MAWSDNPYYISGPIIAVLIFLGGLFLGIWVANNPSEVFKRKQSCESYRGEMQVIATRRSESFGNSWVEEIFYSPLRDSCLFEIRMMDADQAGLISLRFELFDYFSYKQLEHADLPAGLDDSTYHTNRAAFNETVDTYK